MQILDVDENFNFFNPKVGLNWQINQQNRVYASFAVAQKEPTRNNYNDGPLIEHPKAEKLLDWEAGYEFRCGNFAAGANFYYMDYKDQLVLNGKINEIGELMAENVPKSYRMGVELTAGYRFTDWLRWDVNTTLSRNRIKDYVGYVSDYDADSWDDMWTQTEIHAGNTTIAFSPSVTVGSLIAVDYKGFAASFQSDRVEALPPQSLADFAKRIASVRAVVTNDTMALHLAAAANTPVVGIVNGVSGRDDFWPYPESLDKRVSIVGAKPLHKPVAFIPRLIASQIAQYRNLTDVTDGAAFKAFSSIAIA
jgi:outer membrane receptor protein involved in Fe transport